MCRQPWNSIFLQKKVPRHTLSRLLWLAVVISIKVVTADPVVCQVRPVVVQPTRTLVFVSFKGSLWKLSGVLRVILLPHFGNVQTRTIIFRRRRNTQWTTTPPAYFCNNESTSAWTGHLLPMHKEGFPALHPERFIPKYGNASISVQVIMVSKNVFSWKFTENIFGKFPDKMQL